MDSDGGLDKVHAESVCDGVVNFKTTPGDDIDCIEQGRIEGRKKTRSGEEIGGEQITEGKNAE